MNLTEKAKEEFELWYLELVKSNSNASHSRFWEAPIALKWGFIQDFFDLKGFYIDINTEIQTPDHSKPDMWYFQINSDSEQIGVGCGYNSRTEAREVAIKKANELYNA